MGVNNGNAMAFFKIVGGHIGDKSRFAGAGFADNIDMTAPVFFFNAEDKLAVTEFGFAEEAGFFLFFIAKVEGDGEIFRSLIEDAPPPGDVGDANVLVGKMPKSGQLGNGEGLKMGDGARLTANKVIKENSFTEEGWSFGAKAVAVAAIEDSKRTNEVIKLGAGRSGKAQASPKTNFTGFLTDKIFTRKRAAVAFTVKRNTDFHCFLASGLPAGVVFG